MRVYARGDLLLLQVTVVVKRHGRKGIATNDGGVGGDA